MLNDDTSRVKVDLGDGAVVLVEAHVDDPEIDIGAEDLFKFDGVENAIRSIGGRVRSAVDAVKPDAASVEFGLDVSVESGALTGLLAKGTGGASIKVTLEWESSAGA